MFHKPTDTECRLINGYAERAADGRFHHIELAHWFNSVGQDKPDSVNMLIAGTADWESTDLIDTVSWEAFQRGFPLTAQGDAVLDFFVYNTDEDFETSVQAHWEGGRLVRLTGTDSPTVEL